MSTPEIYYAGEIATFCWSILWISWVWCAEAGLEVFGAKQDWKPLGILALLIPWPIWGLSHLFGPVIAWAFVFAAAFLVVLIVIAYKLERR